MSQESQEKPGGNTKTPGPKHQLYRWFVTLPRSLDDNISASQISQHLKSFCKKFTFQLEKGDETGYEHWQMEISLITKEYMQSVKNLLGWSKAHIEPTKDYFAAVNYCKKNETRLEGPWTEKSKFIKTPKLKHKWQTDLLEEVHREPEYRKIIWICDKIGGIGKTDFCLNMYDLHGATVFNNGKFADIAYALPEDPKIVIFDLPKTLEERVNYTAIEAVKNGFVFSGKYESSVKRFDKPHVIVMANFEPDYDGLVKDRWEVRIINKDLI